MERERDKAREERDKLKQLLAADSENVDAYLGVCIERDEARRDKQKLLEELVAIKKERNKLRDKLDVKVDPSVAEMVKKLMDMPLDGSAWFLAEHPIKQS